jgi:glycosyltransferase involved in cell wall biosynthesis
MKRIFFDARVMDTPTPSGIGLYARHLLAALLESQPDEFAFTAFFNSWHPPRVPAFIDAAPNGSAYVTRYPNKAATLVSVLAAPLLFGKALDQAHLCHFPHINAFGGSRLPTLQTVHDLSFEKFPQYQSPRERLWHRYMAHAARRGDYFVTGSHAAKQDLMHSWDIPSARIRVIYHGLIDEGVAQPALLERFALRPEQYFLYVGDLDPRKNLLRLIAGFAALTQTPAYADLKLVLAGKPGADAPAIRREIKRRHLEDRVVLTGYIDADTKKTLLVNALAFVYISLYEGFGLPILEAMHAPLPLLLSNISALPEVAGDEADYVDPFDVEEIHAALRRLADDDAHRARRKAAGKQRVGQFTWSRAAAAFTDYYRTILY